MGTGRLRNRVWLTVGPALVGILFLVACGGGGSDAGPETVATNTPAQASGQAADDTTAAANARVIDMTLQFVVPRFQPDPIVVKVGEPIKFVVNTLSARHTFTIDELGIDEEVPQPSRNVTVTTDVVTPQRTGDFLVFCRIHTRLPMEGRLIVTD